VPIQLEREKAIMPQLAIKGIYKDGEILPTEDITHEEYNEDKWKE